MSILQGYRFVYIRYSRKHFANYTAYYEVWWVLSGVSDRQLVCIASKDPEIRQGYCYTPQQRVQDWPVLSYEYYSDVDRRKGSYQLIHDMKPNVPRRINL